MGMTEEIPHVLLNHLTMTLSHPKAEFFLSLPSLKPMSRQILIPAIFADGKPEKAIVPGLCSIAVLILLLVFLSRKQRERASRKKRKKIAPVPRRYLQLVHPNTYPVDFKLNGFLGALATPELHSKIEEIYGNTLYRQIPTNASFSPFSRQVNMLYGTSGTLSKTEVVEVPASEYGSKSRAIYDLTEADKMAASVFYIWGKQQEIKRRKTCDSFSFSLVRHPEKMTYSFLGDSYSLSFDSFSVTSEEGNAFVSFHVQSRCASPLVIKELVISRTQNLRQGQPDTPRKRTLGRFSSDLLKQDHGFRTQVSRITLTSESENFRPFRGELLLPPHASLYWSIEAVAYELISGNYQISIFWSHKSSDIDNILTTYPFNISL